MARFLEDYKPTKKKKKETPKPQKVEKSPSVTKVNNKASNSTFMGGGSSVKKVEQRQSAAPKRQTTTTTPKRTTMTDAQYQKTYGEPRRATAQRTSIAKPEPVRRTTNHRLTAAQTQKMYGTTNPKLQTAEESRREREERRKEREGRRLAAQRQKSGLNDQPTAAQKAATDRALKNTLPIAKESAKGAVYGHLTTLNDIASIKSQGNGKSREEIYDPNLAEKSRQQAEKRVKKLQAKTQETEDAIQKLTKNAKGLEKAYYGAVESGTGMLTDVGIGALTGTGQVGSLAAMYSRTYGSTRGKAQKEGATQAEDRAYAAAQAAKEVGTELMFPGAGLARGYAGKQGLKLADTAANILTKNLRGKAADLGGAGVRLIGGVLEENAEEVAGWGLDPLIKEITYGKKARTRNAQQAMKERSNALRAEIQNEDDARAAAAYLSSDDFFEQTVNAYREAGLSKKDAEEVADRMRDYLTASLTGDTDSMEQIEDEVSKKVAGSKKLEWDFDELKDTIASTTLLTAATGLPGTGMTAVKGAALRDQLGDDGVRALANTAIDFEDGEMSLKAKAMKARLDSGNELTSTQVYDLQVGMQEQIRKDTQREESSRRMADKRIKSDNLLTPYRQNENGGIDLDEATEASYREHVSRANEIIDGLTSETKESLTANEKVDGSKAIAGFQTGVFTIEDANTLNYSNTTVRAAFEEATGVDLGQYVVRNKDGSVNIPATNTKTKDALFAMAADNLVKSAQAETQNWMDNAKGQVVTQVSARMGASGGAVLQQALDDVDERDRSKYMMTANATDMLYQAARNMGTEWSDIAPEATRMFPGISESKLKMMYEAGLADREMANDKARGRQVRMGQALTEMGEQETATGKVFIDTEVPIKGSVIRTFTEIAKNLGADIHFVDYIYDSENNPISGANGSYDPNTNTFYLNVATGAETNIGYIFMHETTHYLKTYAPEQYQALENLVRERWFAFNPSQMQDAIARKIEAYKRATKGQQVLTEEQALEEIIADASHDFINDPEFARQVAEEDMGLAKAVLDSIRNALRMLRRIFASGSIDDDTHMNSLFRELDIMTEAEKLWLDAYKVAVQNSAINAVNAWQDEVNEASSTRGTVLYDEANIDDLDMTNKTVEDSDGNPIAQFQDNGDVSFSISSYEDKGRDTYIKYLNKMVKSKELSQEEADDMLRELDTIYNISKRYADSGIYAPFSAWSSANVVYNEKGKPVFSAIKKNSEYKMNIDFSTICKKRRTLDAVFREMINRGMFEKLDLNKDESAAMVVNINNLIRQHKFEAACALCFVEARRYRQQQTATTFTNMWNELVESMYEDKSKIAYFNFGEDSTVEDVPDGIHTMDAKDLDLSYIKSVANATNENGKKLQTAEAKAARLILKDPSQRKLMRVGDMMASTGFENMQIQNPKLMKIYNAKKGTGGAKSSFGDVQYLNEILRSKTFDRRKAYAVSGVRIQSFSYYVPRMVFDYVQVIADLAAKKLPAHAYTKEKLFAYQFGLTGAKINLSLVPDVVADSDVPGLDKDGNYVWNEEGTFPYEEALELQKAEGYKNNCGTIAVGISDEQIRKMLADPTIQMVIPYHKSSLNPIVAAMTNVDRFKDYTDFQNTKDAEGKTVSKDFDWDNKLFELTHDKEGKQLPKEQWGNVQDLVKEYADWCKERNYTPKFSDFLYMDDGSINPGYYKLLEDFALLDNDGNFKPQGDVQMRFPTESDAFGSMASLIEQGLTEDTELEAKREKEIGSIVDEIDEMFNAGTLTEQSATSEKLAQRLSISDTDSDGNILTDGQMEYFKNSQARNSEGKMQVVYHTTNYGGFTIFDPSYSDDKRSLFFASNFDVSQTYGRNANKAINLNPPNRIYASWAEVENDIENRFPEWLEEEDDMGQYLTDVSTALNAFVFRKKDHKYADELGVEDGFDKWVEMSENGEDTSDYYVVLTVPKASGWIDVKADTLAELLTKLANELETGQGKQRGYYSCYLNLENPLIVDAKGANWNRISYDPYGNETAGITVQDAIEQIESADIADYGIKNIDVEFEYNDDGFPIAVSYDIGLLGIPDEEHWEWTNYVESDSFEPNVEEYTDNGVLDNAELGIAMWTWVEDKLRNYVSDGMIDMMEQTNIDVNGELHYESFNKTGYDFIRGGNIVDVSEFTDNIDDASGKEYTVNTRDLAEIAENYGHDGVIIRNLMDIGGASSLKGGQALSDIFIAFSSNQVKDINNENPTENPDIRYSFTPEDDAMEWLASQYELDDVPLEDPKAEEGRVRMAKSKQDFIKSRNALWNERWLTEGKVLDAKSVRKNIKELVTGAMMNSDTSRKYKTELVDKTLTDAKSAFWLMKEGKHSEAADLLWDSAVKMIENVDFIEDENFKNYKDLRDYMRTTSFRLGEEYWSDVDFSAFRKRNFGKIKLVKGETNIDEIYQELQERWPEWFDEDEQMTAPDQLLHIEEVLDAIQPYKIAYSSEEAEQLAGDIASDLYDIVYEGEEYKSIADTYKERYDAKTKALKERHQEALRKVREEGDLKVRKEKAKFKEYKEQKKNAKEKAKHFGRIAANIDWLTDRLLNETKDKNIPEGFRKSLAHMLMQFDMQTERSKALEKKYGVAKKTLQMRELQKRLEQIAKEDDTGEFRYDGYLFYLMDALAEKVDGKPIDSLDTEDLIVIDTMLRSIKHNFSNYNKVRLEEEKVAIANIGDSTIAAMEERIKKYGKRKNRTGTLGLFDKLVNEGEQTPIYLFERLDPTGQGIGAMYKELRRGEDQHIRNMNFLRNRFQSMFQEYFNKSKPGSELESWRDDSQAQTFNLENGAITLNPAQIMSLYCLSKRTQAMGHILGSGIVASPINVGQKLHDQFKGKDEQVNSVRITYSEIQDIITKLTPEQMKLADEMQSLLNNEMAAWGNETSLEMHGIKLFREKDYFPIKSSGESLAKTADSFDVQEKIKNFGFTKPLVRNANNAIMIDDIFSVVADHCNKMSLYNSMAIPISDFMRVYNYKQRREDGTVKTSVQAMIGDAFTRKVNDYIMKFIGDVNGNTKTRSDAVNDLMNKALANYKKASIGANFRVALQQPTAIFRSLMAIDAKYFVGIKPISPADVKEMFEHCPIALWKSWGHYDMDMGRDIEDIMMNNDWSRWDTVTMGGYGALDNWTWGLIWQAVKKEVKANNPNVKVGSDEFFRLCNERASEVFDKTQVVDSIFHRSDTMRSKNTLTKMATSFMAEPTLTFNVFRDSLVKANEMWKDGDKAGAAMMFNKMAFVLALNAAAVSASAAIWDAVRGKGGGDDDDDEGFAELWLANFKQNFLDNAPWAQWNNIYFVKDIISLKDGWGTSNMALEGFETIFKGMDQLKKKITEGSDKSWYDIFMNLFGGFGYVTGVPVKTIMRDVKAVFEKFGIDVFAADGTEEDESLIDTIANKMGYKPIQQKGDGEAKVKDSFFARLGIGKTEEEKEQDEFDKKAEEIAGKTADLTGEAKDKKVWSYVTTYMKSQNGDKPLADVIQEGDYKKVQEYRDMYVAAGGDTEYFDERIFAASKSAMKKTIVYDPTDAQIEAQENIKDYLLNHGMTDAELSEMAYKSYTAKDMKIAFIINDKDAMLETLEPLVRAGLSYEDLERIWKNRNRIDVMKYKSSKGRYADRLKSTGKFIWPTDGQITSYFGYRNAPTAGASSNHPAIDIGAPMGTDVVAADGGVVIYAGTNGGYGNSVGIKHDNGMVTYYNHLSAWNVKVGDTVAQGQQIANVGSTGISTGPHLDFKILDGDGEPVDPLKYLASRS